MLQSEYLSKKKAQIIMITSCYMFYLLIYGLLRYAIA
jgi:hypothetical protein